MGMKVSIVILNWNGVDMMRRFLPSVVANSPEADIIVVDNGSTDDSLLYLETEMPQVRRVLLDKNYGFAEGYHRGLKEVESPYYLLLNSDVEVREGWLQPMLSYMDAHPEVAACQPKIRCQWAPEYFEYAGASGGFIDAYGYPFCRGRIFSTVEKDEGQYDDVLPVLWATGASLMIRSRDYWEVGGLDGRFFAHQEEIDLCWRLRSRGRGVVVVPQSVVYHLGGGTLPQGNPRKEYLNFRNNMLLLYKNLPEDRLRPSCACASGSTCWLPFSFSLPATSARPLLSGRGASTSIASVVSSGRTVGRTSAVPCCPPYPSNPAIPCFGSIMSKDGRPFPN